MQGITQKVLRDREVAVFSWCRMRDVPIAFVLAGGYLGPGLEPAGLVALHRLTLEAAYAYGGPGLQFRLERNSKRHKLARRS
jgi:hypothetical protein